MLEEIDRKIRNIESDLKKLEEMDKQVKSLKQTVNKQHASFLATSFTLKRMQSQLNSLGKKNK